MAQPGRSHLRLVQDPEPLGSYIRPFARDYKRVAELLAEGKEVGTGIVVDACPKPRTDDLIQAALEEGLEIVLDPRSVELALPGGRTSSVVDLPWAGSNGDGPDSFSAGRIRRYAEAVAAKAVESGATGVLAPTHFLEAFPSPWFDVDLKLTTNLRSELDRASSRAIAIHYPLVSSLSIVRHSSIQHAIFGSLRELRERSIIDTLWFRIHGFGTTSSGPLNLKRYMSMARAAHQLGIPVVAERTGTVGLALLAFGAVAGIESGIAFGDRYDLSRLKKSSTGKGFLQAPRVYLPDLGVCLKRTQTERLLENRSLRNWLVCQSACCPRGAADMIADPRRHFLVTRTAEVERLGRVPVETRADHYLERWLRPASDRATKAARVDLSLQRQRERLDQWRTTLSEIREKDRTVRPSISPNITQSFRHVSGA